MGDAGVDDLAQVVGRNVGRHADGDAARAVHQQVGKLGRQDHRLLERGIVVLAELHRALVEVVEQRVRDLGQPALGIPLRCRRIAVDRAEVALAVDQRQAHGEVLRHAHQGVVDREVAVRVILAHHLADHAGALHVFLVPVEPQLVHAEEDAPVHGLEAVAHVGQRPGDDHAHGVIEVGALHLVGDGDGPDVAAAPAAGRAAARRIIVVRHLGYRLGLHLKQNARQEELGLLPIDQNVPRNRAAAPLIQYAFSRGNATFLGPGRGQDYGRYFNRLFPLQAC